VHSLKSTRAALDAAEVYLPRFVWRELESVIDCGVLERGFVRVVCGACKHERLVGFSCKGRGVCSSCVGRKMSELAFHLDDHVVPLVPIRQFVLSLPIQLRFLVARDPDLLSAVRRVFLRAVSGFYRKAARDIAFCKTLRTAGLCITQRSGSALNLNPHLHSIFVDCAYRDDEDGKPLFVATPAIEKKAQDRLLARIVAQLLKTGKKVHLLQIPRSDRLRSLGLHGCSPLSTFDTAVLQASGTASSKDDTSSAQVPLSPRYGSYR